MSPETGPTLPVERYTPGHPRALVSVLAKRGARREAAFGVPYLRPGLSLLDCGCGPGSITVELAAELAPGRAVGIDIHDAQFDVGRRLADKRGVTNVEFQRASVYELPFADESFDVVFAHGLLYHLARPDAALLEMRRVLRPGGTVALRDYDNAGNVVAPDWPLSAQSNVLFDRLLRHAGGDPSFGRKQGTLLRQAGFHDIWRGASFDVYQTPEEIEAITLTAVQFWQTPENRDAVVARGWTTSEELDAIVAGLRSWARQPEPLFARARCEAIGFKRSGREQA